MSHILLNSAEIPADAQRILVIRLGAMGDVVRTLPAVAELRVRRPDAEIHWLLEARVRDVVEPRPYVDAVVEFPREAIEAAVRGGRLFSAARQLRDFSKQLRDARYDAVLDFHSIARSALLSCATRAPLRVTYAPPHAREGAQYAATHRARLVPKRISRFERNQTLVDFVAAPTAGVKLATSLLDLDPSLVLPAGAPAPIVLHPGASAVAGYKRWSIDGFAELAMLLVADGEQVLVAHGPGEAADAASIVDRSCGAAALAPATESFDALAALLASARAFVAADSGPLHVASLVGTPVVQLLGPTHPVENSPWRQTASISVRGGAALGCSPCRRGCSAAACMREIGSAEVYAALRELVAAPQREVSARPPSAPRGHNRSPTPA